MLQQAGHLAGRAGDRLTLSYVLRHLRIAEHAAGRPPPQLRICRRRSGCRPDSTKNDSASRSCVCSGAPSAPIARRLRVDQDSRRGIGVQRESVIDLASMSDGDHEDQQLLIADLVDDPVITRAGDSNTPAVLLPDHRPTPGWSRIGLEVGELEENPTGGLRFELA